MKRFLSLLTCSLAALCLSGCFQIEKTVKLKPDGSGTIEETMMMSKAMADQMKAMGAQFSKGFGGKEADAKPQKEFNLLDEDKLKKEAAAMGEGVTYVGAKKVSTDTGEGYTATFAFTDINKLKLDQNPGSAAPKMGPSSDTKPEKHEIINFQFTKGSPAELVITMPPQKFDKKDKPDKKENNAAAMQMAMQFFKDMKIKIGIEVQGKITETNASYHDDSRVTVIELDFNKLLGDPKKFEEFSAMNPQSLEEAKKLLKQIPGLKVETNSPVKVKFQ